MTQELKRVVILAGSGVPAHMIGLLRDSGATVITSADPEKVSPDALRLLATDVDWGQWHDEADRITPEMIAALRPGLEPFLTDLRQPERPWMTMRPEPMSKRKARRLRGTR